jgi:predicted helicase
LLYRSKNNNHYVQAKRWAATVGRPEIQKFAGALHGQYATKGIFITTSDFSRDADEYVAKIGSKIVLIDGSRLAELMIEFGVTVATDATYTVKSSGSITISLSRFNLAVASSRDCRVVRPVDQTALMQAPSIQKTTR